MVSWWRLYYFAYIKNQKELAIAFLDHEETVEEEDLVPEDLAKHPVEYWLDKNLYPVVIHSQNC